MTGPHRLSNCMRIVAVVSAIGLAGCASAAPAARAEGVVSPKLTAAIADGVGGASAGAGVARFDAAGRVQTYVHCATGSDLAVVRTAILKLGGSVELVDDELAILQAWLPTVQVGAVAALAQVEKVGLPSYGHHR